MIYQFSVDKTWKGDKLDTIEIKTGLGGQDCGMIFEIGRVLCCVCEKRRNITLPKKRSN